MTADGQRIDTLAQAVAEITDAKISLRDLRRFLDINEYDDAGNHEAHRVMTEAGWRRSVAKIDGVLCSAYIKGPSHYGRARRPVYVLVDPLGGDPIITLSPEKFIHSPGIPGHKVLPDMLPRHYDLRADILDRFRRTHGATYAVALALFEIADKLGEKLQTKDPK